MKYIAVGNVYKVMDRKDDNVLSIKDFKFAKLHLEKLEAIKVLLQTSIKGFALFEAYYSAAEVKRNMTVHLELVQNQIIKCKRVLNKGKV